MLVADQYDKDGQVERHMTDFTGSWALLGAASHHPTVAYEALGTEGAAEEAGLDAVIGGSRMGLDTLVRMWLAGEVLDAEPALEPASGLTLDVAGDLTFTERGAADVEWFCVEGVLEPRAVPFDGRIVTTPAGAHLLPHEPVPGAEASEEDEGVRLRMDDGDTKIADTVELTGERLRRTMSVVTDEMYVCRLLFEYGRV